jgi:hypothetical protein
MNLESKLQKVSAVLIGGPCDGLRYQTRASVETVLVPSSPLVHRYKLEGTIESPVLNAKGFRVMRYDKAIVAPMPCNPDLGS